MNHVEWGNVLRDLRFKEFFWRTIWHYTPEDGTFREMCYANVFFFRPHKNPIKSPSRGLAQKPSSATQTL